MSGLVQHIGAPIIAANNKTEDPYDSSYRAVLNYAISQGYSLPSTSQQLLQNQLVVSLKSAGIWDKLDTLAVFATDGSSDFALIDWIRLDTYTAVNSPSFVENQGYSGDGSSSFIDTNFNPSIDGQHYKLNDASISIWNSNFTSNSFVSGVAIGVQNCIRMSGTSANIRINMDTNNLSPSVDFSDSEKNLRQLNRVSENSVVAFQDSSSTSHTGASTSVLNSNQLILRADSFYSNTEVRLFAMGAALVSENDDLIDALNTYFDSL